MRFVAAFFEAAPAAIVLDAGSGMPKKQRDAAKESGHRIELDDRRSRTGEPVEHHEAPDAVNWP